MTNSSERAMKLLPCKFCGKPPGTKVGPPSLARCIADGCEGRRLAAYEYDEWNRNNAPSLQHPEAADRASVVEECIAAAKSVGNFGDYKREELTDDYGKPRFDMLNEIIDRLRSLSTQQDKKVAG